MKKLFVLLIPFLLIFGCLSKSPISVINGNGFSIEVKKISPSKNALLKLNQKVFIWLSYKVPDNYHEGVYIWVIPNTKYPILQPSPLIKTKSGSISRYFAINKGNVMIRKIWVRMMNKKKNKILVQKTIKVKFLTNPRSNKGINQL